MTINVDLWQKLEKIANVETLTKAYLLRLSGDQSSWEFLLPPNKIKIDGSNVFRENFSMFGKGRMIKYSASNFCRIQINDLIFMTPGMQRSMLSVEQGLDNLRYADPEELEPSELSFVYGKRSLQPLQLESYSIVEDFHQNGFPLSLTISLNFIATDKINFLGNI